MSYSQEKQVDLREIWQVVAKRKWLLIIPFILIIGISYGGSYLMTPKYESAVVILTSRSTIVTSDIARMIPGEYTNVRMSDRQVVQMMNENAGLVTSGVNLAKVVTQLGLDESEEMMKKAAELQKEFPNIPPQELIYRALMDDLRSRLHVFPSQNMIKITAQSADPIMARDIAQTLAEVYREEKLRQDLLEVRSKLEFSNTQAQIYKKELEDKEEELADFKRNYQKSAIDRGMITQDNLKDIEAELDRTRVTDKVETNDRLSFLETQLSSMGVDPADIKTPPEISMQKRLLLDGTTRLAELMEKYTWRDSKVTNQRRTVEGHLDTINAMIDSLVNTEYAGLADETIDLIAQYLSTRIKLEYLIHKENRLNSSKENIKNSFSTGPDADIQLAKLEKAVERAKSLYDKFYESYTGSQLAMEIYREDAENRYKILEPAFVPLAPFYPNRMKITIMGLALGLLLGIGAMILAEVTDNSIKKIENIESLLNVKVLGTIPKIEFRTASGRKVPTEKRMVGSNKT